MKDEVGGKILKELIGIKATNYSFIFVKSQGVTQEKRTAKGIKKSFIQKHMNHQMLKDCLFDHEQTLATFNLI